MDNRGPLNQEEVTDSLKSYIDDHRGTLLTIGYGVTLFLLGRQSGLKSGYIRGYAQHFKDMITISQKVK